MRRLKLTRETSNAVRAFPVQNQFKGKQVEVLLTRGSGAVLVDCVPGLACGNYQPTINGTRSQKSD